MFIPMAIAHQYSVLYTNTHSFAHFWLIHCPLIREMRYSRELLHWRNISWASMYYFKTFHNKHNVSQTCTCSDDTHRRERIHTQMKFSIKKNRNCYKDGWIQSTPHTKHTNTDECDDTASINGWCACDGINTEGVSEQECPNEWEILEISKRQPRIHAHRQGNTYSMIVL